MNNKLKFFTKGSAVQWKWMGHFVSGTIHEIYNESVTKLIKGKSIKRIGSNENPAYLVQSAAGNLALKLHSELHISESSTAKVSQPKMFGG